MTPLLLICGNVRPHFYDGIVLNYLDDKNLINQRVMDDKEQIRDLVEEIVRKHAS